MKSRPPHSKCVEVFQRWGVAGNWFLYSVWQHNDLRHQPGQKDTTSVIILKTNTTARKQNTVMSTRNFAESDHYQNTLRMWWILITKFSSSAVLPQCAGIKCPQTHFGYYLISSRTNFQESWPHTSFIISLTVNGTLQCALHVCRFANIVSFAFQFVLLAQFR